MRGISRHTLDDAHREDAPGPAEAARASAGGVPPPTRAANARQGRQPEPHAKLQNWTSKGNRTFTATMLTRSPEEEAQIAKLQAIQRGKAQRKAAAGGKATAEVVEADAADAAEEDKILAELGMTQEEAEAAVSWRDGGKLAAPRRRRHRPRLRTSASPVARMR